MEQQSGYKPSWIDVLHSGQTQKLASKMELFKMNSALIDMKLKEKAEKDLLELAREQMNMKNRNLKYIEDKNKEIDESTKLFDESKDEGYIINKKDLLFGSTDNGDMLYIK